MFGSGIVNTHDAESLRLLFPELGLELETEQIRLELEGKLGLQGRVQYLGKSSTLTVVLNDGYELLFTSTVPGFNGTSNWYKWRELVEPVTKRTFRISYRQQTINRPYHFTCPDVPLCKISLFLSWQE